MHRLLPCHLLEMASLALAVYLSVTGASGMQEDEFLCEEALARLDECCTPEDLATVSCTFQAGCMGHDAVTPDISPTDSRCIRHASCEELHARGLCQRLRNGPGYGDPYPELQVCP